MSARASRVAQGGVTLIELMVSVALALLVTLAALAGLLSSRQTGSAMEAATQLRDNARFSTELIRRLALQAGFESLQSNKITREGADRWGGGGVSAASVAYGGVADPAADVEGVNNAIVPKKSDPSQALSRDKGCGTDTSTSCANGSDVLILRFQGINSNGKADGSAINCAGEPVGDAPTAALRPMSAFHVRANAAGEPTLICTTLDAAGGVQDRELIEGVEVFQVLYGIDGVTPGVAPNASAPAPNMVRNYLRADQMVVPSDPTATKHNWRRVRALRIGLVVRGPVGSAADRTLVQRLYPLGELMQNNNDPFSTFITPTDGRLRQEVTFTVLFRNYLGV